MHRYYFEFVLLIFDGWQFILLLLFILPSFVNICSSIGYLTVLNDIQLRKKVKEGTFSSLLESSVFKKETHCPGLLLSLILVFL